MIFTVISRNQAVIRTESYYDALQAYFNKKRHERHEYPQRIRFKVQLLNGATHYLKE